MNTRLTYIDVWRSLAVMLVILSHLTLNSNAADTFDALGLGFLMDFGLLGVFIFFFISGFVVSKVCLNEIRNGLFLISSFYVRRFFRIVPPLMLYLGFCFLLGSLDIVDFSFHNLVSSSSYLCNTSFSFINCNWLGGHTWSLAFEEQFYLIFPMALLLVERGKFPSLLLFLPALSLLLLPLIFKINWIGTTGFMIIHALFFAGFLSARFEYIIQLSMKPVSHLDFYGMHYPHFHA